MVKTITNNNSSDQSSTSRIAKLLAAAGFGGLGVSSGAAGIQQIIRGIVDAKRTKPYEVIPQYVPPKDPLDMLGGPTQSPRQRAMIDFAAKAKAGDVVLTTSIDELPDQTKSMYKTIAGLLAGRADRQHAHMIVPDANGTLRVVTPINERMGGAAVHRPLLQRLWAYGTREIKKINLIGAKFGVNLVYQPIGKQSTWRDKLTPRPVTKTYRSFLRWRRLSEAGSTRSRARTTSCLRLRSR